MGRHKLPKCDICGQTSIVRHDSEAECISFLRSRLKMAESASEKRGKALSAMAKRVESWKAKCSVAQEALKAGHTQTAYERAYEERLNRLELYIEGIRIGRGEIQ